MPQFLTYIFSHWPFLGFLLITAIATWLAANKYHHWANRIKATENDCKEFKPKLTGIDSNISQLNVSISTLNGSFEKLLVHLSAKNDDFNMDLFKSRSPIRLTEIGVILLKDFGGDAYIDTHLEGLLESMDKLGVTSALDSQNVAPVAVSKMFDTPDFKHIKDFVFTNPIYRVENEGTKYEIPLNMNVVAQVMGIYLRDKYLGLHPELNPEDIPDMPGKE